MVFSNYPSRRQSLAATLAVSSSTLSSSSGSSGRSRGKSRSGRRIPPEPDLFELVDWLAVGNHLFTVASLGYCGIDVFRRFFSTQVNSSVPTALINCLEFAIGISYIISSISYIVDILQFPRAWTRRKFYHPAKRSDEVKQMMLATAPDGTRIGNIAPRDTNLYDDMDEWEAVHREGDEEEEDEDEYDDLDDDAPLCQLIYFWPIRMETLGEVLNLLGALLNLCAVFLPYALVTFQSDNNVGFDSVPLSVSIMNFFAMIVWLASSFVDFYVWRRDKIDAACDAWEVEEEERTGIDRAKRQIAEEFERIAEENARLEGRPLPPATAKRFDRSAVKNTWIDLCNMQWWAGASNIIGSAVYWGGSIYGIVISVAAAQGQLRNSNLDGSGVNHGKWILTPQTVQDWIFLQRTFNMLGDVTYLVCAFCCEFVHFWEMRREFIAAPPSAASKPMTRSARRATQLQVRQSVVDHSIGRVIHADHLPRASMALPRALVHRPSALMSQASVPRSAAPFSPFSALPDRPLATAGSPFESIFATRVE